MQRPDFLERMGEGIVANVMKQSGQPEESAFLRGHVRQVASFIEQAERAAGEMVGANRVLEPGVRRTRIDQEREAELTHVSEALKRCRVDQP